MIALKVVLIYDAMLIQRMCFEAERGCVALRFVWQAPPGAPRTKGLSSLQTMCFHGMKHQPQASPHNSGSIVGKLHLA